MKKRRLPRSLHKQLKEQGFLLEGPLDNIEDLPKFCGRKFTPSEREEKDIELYIVPAHITGNTGVWSDGRKYSYSIYSRRRENR